MATQQPLSARGLSRTVLTPPDILGERMQLEQLGLRQDALRASQMAKMPQAKRFEYEGIDRYGDLFSSAYKSVDDQLRRYAEEHAYELSPENPQYNPELRRRFDMTKRNAMEAGALMNRANKTFFEDYETLDDRNKSLSGALAYMSDSAGLGKNFKLDFETGQVGFQVGEELIPYDEVEQITNPRAFYYRPTDWREDILENVKPVYADVETQDQTVKQGILERVSNQIDNNFVYADDADDFKYSVLKSYFENNKGVPRPSDEIIKTIIAEEEYTNPITGETVTLEDALKWGKEQALDLVKNQMGYTKRLPGDGDLNISIGSARNKLGMVDKEALPAPSTDGDRFVGVAKSVDKLTIQTPEGSKVITELYVDPNGIVYYGGSEARFKTKEELDNLSQQYGGIDQVPSEKYFNAFSKHYERAAADEMDSMRSAITRITGFPLNSNNELAGFIGFDGTRREESVDSEQEESPIEGYSMQDINDAANQAGMSVDEYVRWYKENYE